MPLIQLAKVNRAVAMYRRKCELHKTLAMIEQMLENDIKELNPSEFKEYSQATHDPYHIPPTEA